MKRLAPLALACVLAGCASNPAPSGPRTTAAHEEADAALSLGHFSVSLAVKDLAASRAFYETLGFRVIGGDPAQNWLILQNDAATVGLFQGMFDKNMLTFNPGWDRDANALDTFVDVRDIQRALQARGLTPVKPADVSGTGPDSLVLIDPDGNPVLIDQHVPRPGE